MSICDLYEWRNERMLFEGAKPGHHGSHRANAEHKTYADYAMEPAENIDDGIIESADELKNVAEF